MHHFHHCLQPTSHHCLLTMQWPQSLVRQTRLMVKKIPKTPQLCFERKDDRCGVPETFDHSGISVQMKDRRWEARQYRKALLYLQSEHVYSIHSSSWSTPRLRELIKITISRLQKCFVNYSTNGNRDFPSCISHLLTSQVWSELPDLNNKNFWPLHWVGNIVLSLFSNSALSIIFHAYGMYEHFPRGDEDRNNEQSKRNKQLIIYCSVIYQCHWSGDVFISSRWEKVL